MGFTDEVLETALGFARARFEELLDEVVADAQSYADALGVPGFVDAAGTVAAELTSARSELQQVPAALGGGNVVAAAGHLGAFVQHLDAAAAAVPGAPRSVSQVLLDAIGWDDVTPRGLAAQLGLPADVPGLTITGGALVYALDVPGTSVAPAPLTLGFQSAELTARLRLDGGAPLFSISLAAKGIEVGVGGGDVSALLGGAAGSLTSDVVFGIDTDRGLSLGGSASPRVVLPAAPKVGALDIRELALELPPVPDSVDLGSSFSVDLGGVVTGTVDGAGIRAHIDPGAVAAGGSPLSVQAKAPTGIGLVVDAGIVTGGGFVGQRPGGYGGALQLRVGPIEVKAVGLLTLDPEFALVVVLSVEFTPAIDLSFGFTLNAVGGILGIQHRMDTDALREGLSNGALDHLLFPEDPVAAAPTILTTLEKVFPVDPGSIVIGPMVEVGWGRPISFLRAQLGVVISLPDPKVVILGRVLIALPAPELPIVDFRATIYGEITPDYLLVLVSLRNSRIAGFPVSGDIGLLLKWGGGAEFAISAGGFHPKYKPPKQLAGMQRVSIDLSPPAILTLRATAYFAVTSNSLQLGARVDLAADLAVASVSGYLQFDALVVWSPRFLFMIDLGIGLTVRALGVTLCGVNVTLHLEGPAPWRAQGSAEIEILWWTIEVDVGPFTWGEDDNPPPEPAHPRKLVHAALHRNPGSWQAITPPDADDVARMLPVAPSDTDVTVHPLGLFEVRQHAVPLETVVARVAANPVPEGERRVHLGVPLVNATPAGAVTGVTELFAPGSFLDLTDDQKLSRPGFEPMPAGLQVRPPGDATPTGAARQAELRYETFVADDDAITFRWRAELVDVLVAGSVTTTLYAGAAGASPLRARTRYATDPDPIVLADAGESTVRSGSTLADAGGDGFPMSATRAFELRDELVAAGAADGLVVTRLGVG